MLNEYFLHFFQTFTSSVAYPLLKFVVFAGIIVMEFFFGAENFTLINAVLGLVLIDFAAGVFASYKCGEEIESRKAVKTVFKLGAYSLMLSAGHLLEVSTAFPVFSEEAVIAAIAGTEFISIMEKMSKAGYVVPRRLIDRIKNLDLVERENKKKKK